MPYAVWQPIGFLELAEHAGSVIMISCRFLYQDVVYENEELYQEALRAAIDKNSKNADDAHQA